jgi:hypothetical protein
MKIKASSVAVVQNTINLYGSIWLVMTVNNIISCLYDCVLCFPNNSLNLLVENKKETTLQLL